MPFSIRSSGVDSAESRSSSVEAFADIDGNSFDVVIVYDIIGADIPTQQLEFVLQPTR